MPKEYSYTREEWLDVVKDAMNDMKKNVCSYQDVNLHYAADDPRAESYAIEKNDKHPSYCACDECISINDDNKEYDNWLSLIRQSHEGIVIDETTAQISEKAKELLEDLITSISQSFGVCTTKEYIEVCKYIAELEEGY